MVDKNKRYIKNAHNYEPFQKKKSENIYDRYRNGRRGITPNNNNYHYINENFKERNINNIKVRYGGIFSTLDRFIDTNSNSEYAKKALSHRNNSKKLANISK